MTTTAAKILILGGMFNLLWGYATGVVMAKVRTSAPETPKYLSLTHVGGLMWAPILLGLDLLNWLQRVQDEFVTRPLGFALGGLSAVMSTAGTVVLVAGVIRGL
jgi:hypothetical protein